MGFDGKHLTVETKLMELCAQVSGTKDGDSLRQAVDAITEYLTAEKKKREEAQQAKKVSA